MHKPRPIIYIAGPFRARTAEGSLAPWKIEQNVRIAEGAALEIWHLGGVAVCPHTMSRFFQGALPDTVWEHGYLDLLSKCDGIFLLPRWRESPGTIAEWRKAKRLGLPIFEDYPEFVSWISTAWPTSLPV